MKNNNPPTIITPISKQLAPGARWQPEVGRETHRLLTSTLGSDAGRKVLDAATSILSRGVSPSGPADQITGLVVGYVQSGKTLSFTTVMALARDNDYQLAIAITGTSKPLLNQSTRRLRNDLLVEELDGHPRWATYTNPPNNDLNRRFIQQALDEWNDPDVPSNERATVLITVMKNHHHLANLVALLERLKLEKVPTLIIDDEADQASLNTLVRRGRESTTYVRLLQLRKFVPWHTFLQYTATPQAPLLINIIDSLSPRFAEVLDPGHDYVGGRTFFGGDQGLTRVIPPVDIPSASNPLDYPPPSLLEALRVFLVGVVAGLIQGRSRANAHRSMLVHPSRSVAKHQEYRQWIACVLDEWQRILELPEQDSDHADLIEDLEEAHVDLLQSFPQLPPFEEIRAKLKRAFRQISIEEVNTRRGSTPLVDWSRAYGWILVGGQAMDRGFTVEGLTVTYMPRGPGVGNADTIQQRARFFGYKTSYLGFCRIYLEQTALTAFEHYVSHEEEMRQQLKGFGASGQPLSDWKRAFVLSPALKPCRKNVIQYDYARGGYSNQWYSPKMVDTPDEVTEENRDTVAGFERNLTFTWDTSFASIQQAQRHLVCKSVPLEVVLSDLLVPYRVSDARDTLDRTGLWIQLSKALDLNGGETAAVYRMRPNYRGTRDVDPQGRITSTRRLFQGPTKLGANGRSYSYPGDARFSDKERVTIQLHEYNLRRNKKTIAFAMPVIAVWVPSRMRLDWLVQPQPN